MPPLSDDKQLRSHLESTDRDLAACRERLAQAMPIVRLVAVASTYFEEDDDEAPAFVLIGLHSYQRDLPEITVKQVREAAALVAIDQKGE